MIFPPKIFSPVVDMFVATDVMVVSHRPPGNIGSKMVLSPEVYMVERVANHMLLNHVNITPMVTVLHVLVKKEPLQNVFIIAKTHMAWISFKINTTDQQHTGKYIDLVSNLPI